MGRLALRLPKYADTHDAIIIAQSIIKETTTERNQLVLLSILVSHAWESLADSKLLFCLAVLPEVGMKPDPAYLNPAAVLSAQPMLQPFPWEA